jgi:octaprenyl-diphosphate synthase
LTPKSRAATVPSLSTPPQTFHDRHRPAPRGSDAFALVFERISGSLELVERALREQLSSEAELVGLLGDHVFSSGGKRLRPALLLLTAELCGYTGPRRIQIAAALEMLHTATLLHDDVVDTSELRRGRPSANAIWGNRRAVLGGDFFYARASSMIVEDGDLGILESFASTIRLMAEGELLQLQRSFDASVTESHYYDVIDRKSATLLKTACEAGAILGGVTRAELRRVASFGRELGLAFQLKDDALDYDTNATTLGKIRYADLREGKVTLPLLLTLKRCTSSEHERASSILKSGARRSAEALLKVAEGDTRSADELAAEEREAVAVLEPVIDLVGRYHGVTDTLRRADEHVTRGTDAIAAFPDGIAKQALLSAAAFTVSRDR